MTSKETKYKKRYKTIQVAEAGNLKSSKDTLEDDYDPDFASDFDQKVTGGPAGVLKQFQDKDDNPHLSLGEYSKRFNKVYEHVVGSWRKKFDQDTPEIIHRSRHKYERRYNPLIKLLGIKLASPGEGAEGHFIRRKGEQTHSSSESSPDEATVSLAKPRNKRKTKKQASKQLTWEEQVKEDLYQGINHELLYKWMSHSLKGQTRVLEEENDFESEESDLEEDEDIAKDVETTQEDTTNVDSTNQLENKEADRELSKIERRQINETLNDYESASDLEREEPDTESGSDRPETEPAAGESEPDTEEESESEASVENNRTINSFHKEDQFPYTPEDVRPAFPIISDEMESTPPHTFNIQMDLQVCGSDKLYQIPATINRFLRPYQRDGVEFMTKQYALKRGSLLGDDMGLGKTIQVIGFLASVMRISPDPRLQLPHKKFPGLNRVGGTEKMDLKTRDAGVDRWWSLEKKRYEKGAEREWPNPSNLGATALITCPASVVFNWKEEIEKWTYLDVEIIEKHSQMNEPIQRFSRGLLDIVICSHDTARSAISTLKHLDFTIIIVDEAHVLKNPKSDLTKALHEFETRSRIALTGTAIQNNLEEFWCILNWIAPGEIGTRKAWNTYVSRPIKLKQQANASKDMIARGTWIATALVTKLLPNFWLRRTKEQANIQLLKKYDNVILCPLTPEQRMAYENLIKMDHVQNVIRGGEPCGCKFRDEANQPFKRRNCCHPISQGVILTLIQMFQKVANHAGLIYPDNANSDGLDQTKKWVKVAFPDDYKYRTFAQAMFQNEQLCGKWKIIQLLLARWKASDDKVLIFSRNLKILQLLQTSLEAEYSCLVLDGSVSKETRMERVHEFNTDPTKFIFLISTAAGGVGLTLTSANRVIIFDPSWNPSADIQAQDRAYRFGQQRDVEVYRLMGEGTIEEIMYNRQQYKRAQANVGYNASSERRLYQGAPGESNQAGHLWGAKNLFTFTHNLTQSIIEEYNLNQVKFGEQSDLGKVKQVREEGSINSTITQNAEENDEALGDLFNDIVGDNDNQRSSDVTVGSILNSVGAIRVDSNKLLGNSAGETKLAREAIKHVKRRAAKDRQMNPGLSTGYDPHSRKRRRYA